jgi:hypothetical protein
MRVPADSKNR